MCVGEVWGVGTSGGVVLQTGGVAVTVSRGPLSPGERSGSGGVAQVRGRNTPDHYPGRPVPPRQRTGGAADAMGKGGFIYVGCKSRVPGGHGYEMEFANGEK